MGAEESIHQFIGANQHVLDFLDWDRWRWSKFPLGTSFITDFVSVGRYPYSNRPQPLITFVELERADVPLFTKAGDPAAFLTHALRQIHDWKGWVRENRAFLATEFHRRIDEVAPSEADRELRRHLYNIQGSFRYGFVDRYLIIAGRRPVAVSDRLRLSQMNDDLHAITIITYDALLDGIVRMSGHRRRPSSDE